MAKKPVTKRTKKTNEEKYAVDMEPSKGSPASFRGNNKVSKEVDATSPEDAVRKAKQGDTGRYDSVTAKKADGGNDGKPKGLGESVDFSKLPYPYSIVLPIAFTKLVESIQKKMQVSESLTLVEKGGRVHIKVESKKVMAEFFGLLERSRDKAKAGIIAEGIKRSV